VLLPKGLGRADAAGADATHLFVRVEGVETKYAWDVVPAKSFVKLFKQAGFTSPPRLGVALFFDEEAIPDEAMRAYVACFKADAEKQALERILARRRGLRGVPEGGFEVFRNDLVTVAEREKILLDEKIEKLGRQGRSPIETRRREGWDELEKLGPPAAETLAACLRERRAAVAQELAGSSAFAASRYASRIGPELERRRKDALAFVMDPNKYPYPNKTEEAQKEAERLVGLVRDLWEKPYEALLATSDDAKALDAELTDLDGRIAKCDPLDEPTYDAVVAEIQKKLEPARIPMGDDKRVDYYFAALKYNRELESSASDEERANVEAVNEYRHMMGLWAVKIDERLVRAARKHSIEMKQEDYFAHDSPTPHLRSPGQRAQREGYGGGVSENIARGASTGRQAFWQWFGSSGHHRNMLVAGHTDLGCGACDHHWWTQNFGRASGHRLEPPKVPKDPDPPGSSGNGKPPPG
jgi:hypothetical protein